MEERVCPTWIVSTYKMLPDCSLGVGIWSYLTHHAPEIVSICLHIFSHKKYLLACAGQHTVSYGMSQKLEAWQSRGQHDGSLSVGDSEWEETAEIKTIYQGEE